MNSGGENSARGVALRRLIVVAVFLLVWESAIRLNLLDPLWTSYPSAIAAELYRLSVIGRLWTDMAVTVATALAAFAISVVFGVGVGLLLSRSAVWDEVMSPIIAVLNSIPRVAIAPLFIIWFGIGVNGKIATAVSLAFFIMLINTLAGAKSVDHDLIDISRLMGASEREILWKVILPSSLPWIFAGMNLSLTYSLLGVIVAELLSANRGIGYLITSSAAIFHTAGVMAAIVALGIISYIFNSASRWAEARLLKWRPETRTE